MEETKKEELAIARRLRDGKYNLIDSNGKLLSEQWFEWIGCSFYYGFAIVKRDNGEYNLIDTKGKLFSDEWFRWVNFDEYDLAKVQRTNGEWAKIDKTGEIIVCK